jgi:acetylornithine deacetylase/succinyl-diaminopimelate desuccinylase-like protein
MGFEFTVFGADRLLHESAVPFARNPTYWQAEVIEALMKLNRALSKRKNRFVGPPYINVMSVSHPIFSNTIPTSIKIKGTRRVNPGETREDVLKEFDVLFGDLCKRSPLRIEMNVTGEPVPWEISPKEPVVKSLQKAFKQVTKNAVLLGGYPANGDGRWYNKGVSEWHKKHNKKGIVTTCFGADHASAHSNIEYVDTKQLETVAKVCALAALDFCGRT